MYRSYAEQNGRVEYTNRVWVDSGGSADHSEDRGG
jgi:hypothetical protein